MGTSTGPREVRYTCRLLFFFFLQLFSSHLHYRSQADILMQYIVKWRQHYRKVNLIDNQRYI